MGVLRGQIITEEGQECICCRRVLPWASFERDRSRKNGYKTRCKECKKKTKGTKRYYVVNERGRECTICKTFKAWDEFHMSEKMPGGHKGQCKDCKRESEGKMKKEHFLITETGRQCTACKEFKLWNEFNKLPKGAYGYGAQCKECMHAKIYGLTLVQLREMKERSGGHCDICGREARLGIDHNHETGEVRGLLCDNCNLMIGLAGDSIDILLSTIKYLTRRIESENEDA